MFVCFLRGNQIRRAPVYKEAITVYTCAASCFLGDNGQPQLSNCVSFGFKHSCCLLPAFWPELFKRELVDTFSSEVDLIDNPFGFCWTTAFAEAPLTPREVFDLDNDFRA